MMKRLWIGVLLVVGLLGMSSRPTSILTGLIWAKNSAVFIHTSQVCRDGAAMHVTYWTSTGEDSSDGDGTVVHVDARLLTTPDVPLPQTSEGSNRPGVSYGPRLTKSEPITMTYQNGIPFPADLDQDGTKEYNFYVYERAHLTWPRHLDAGDMVVFTQGETSIYALEVADCFLNPLGVAAKQTAVITQSHLDSNHGLLPDESIAYQLDTLPAHGQLQLNGITLTTNDTFTQADINNGNVTYTHTGGVTDGTDRFDFTVKATHRLSVHSDGSEALNGDSTNPTISHSGSRVAYQSDATNLVDGDTNGDTDIFLHDLATATTQRISLDYNGSNSNGVSLSPAISGDGTAVAFSSTATDLVGAEVDGCGQEPDTNGFSDIFVYRVIPDSLYRASTTSVTFNSCDQANGHSYAPSMAYDWVEGAVAFYSYATNLQGTDSNMDADIFVNDRTFSGTTWRYTDSATFNDGSFYPQISDDGEHVVFHSNATNVVPGNDSTYDIFAVRRFPTEVELISVNSSGEAGNDDAFYPSVSENGRFVAFYAYATNLVDKDTNNVRDIFVRDREAGITERISVSSSGVEANNHSLHPQISPNGRFVVFESLADNLVRGDNNGDWDVFLHDRLLDTTTRVSVASDGTEGDYLGVLTPFARDADLSADGEYIVFESSFNNLVLGDGNNHTDVFIHYVGYNSSFVIQIELEETHLPLLSKP